MRWKICRHCIAVTNHGDKWCIWYLCVCIFLPIGKNLVDLPPHCNTWWWRQVVTIIGICVFVIFANWQKNLLIFSAHWWQGVAVWYSSSETYVLYFTIKIKDNYSTPLFSYMHLNHSAAAVLKQIPLAARCATLVSIQITEIQKYVIQ